MLKQLNQYEITRVAAKDKYKTLIDYAELIFILRKERAKFWK